MPKAGGACTFKANNIRLPLGDSATYTIGGEVNSEMVVGLSGDGGSVTEWRKWSVKIPVLTLASVDLTAWTGATGVSCQLNLKNGYQIVMNDANSMVEEDTDQKEGSGSLVFECAPRDGQLVRTA